MAAAKRAFRDSSDDDLDKIANLSDADLDRLMGGGSVEAMTRAETTSIDLFSGQ